MSTGSRLEVECRPGFDGGLPQTFVMEVRRTGGSSPSALVTNDTQSARPRFSVGGLTPGSIYRLTIYSVNVKGKSKAIVIEAEAGGKPVPKSPSQKELLQTASILDFSAGTYTMFDSDHFYRI